MQKGAWRYRVQCRSPTPALGCRKCKLMELTPVSEISSTAEYEEERELVGVASRASPAKRIEETKPKVKCARVWLICKCVCV